MFRCLWHGVVSDEQWQQWQIVIIILQQLLNFIT